MAYYYLVAGLPMLVLDQAVPFTPEEFFISCSNHLSDSDRADMRLILEGHAEQCGNRLVRKWVDRETQIRNALAQARAASRKTDAAPFLHEHRGYDVGVENLVDQVMGFENPLDRELALDRFRWRCLDDLALADPFGAFTLHAFLIKLQLACRWSGLTDAKGKDRLDDIVEKNLQQGIV